MNCLILLPEADIKPFHVTGLFLYPLEISLSNLTVTNISKKKFSSEFTRRCIFHRPISRSLKLYHYAQIQCSRYVNPIP